MAERIVDRPGFDDYVVARGGDLLRTAWLLVGDDHEARRLVRTALARAWPQWSHLAEHGAGSYDTDLRRFLVQAHLRHHRPSSHTTSDLGKTSATQQDPQKVTQLVDATKGLEQLDSLTRVERVVLVLVLFDGLGEGQVADLLDDDIGSVRRHLVHALAGLRDRFGLDERGVKGLLESLAPADPSVDPLLSRELGRAPRGRGLRGWLFAVAAVGVTALVANLVPHGGGGGATPSPGPTTVVPSALSCRSSPGPPAPPRPVEPPLSARFVAVLVCARNDDGSVWSGSLPPDDPVTDPVALDALVLEPRGGGAACPDLPHGPAFRLLLLGRDGTSTTWANEGLACDGYPALAAVYVATAEQAAQSVSAGDGFLGCPAALGGPPDQQTGESGGGQGLRRGTVLVEATACLHPQAQARPRAIPRFHEVRGNVLGTPDLAQLNAELARAGSRRTRQGDCADGPFRYVIRARTDAGRLVELSSTCGREFAVDGHTEQSWPVGPDTTSMLRALLIAN